MQQVALRTGVRRPAVGAVVRLGALAVLVPVLLALAAAPAAARPAPDGAAGQVARAEVPARPDVRARDGASSTAAGPLRSLVVVTASHSDACPAQRATRAAVPRAATSRCPSTRPGGATAGDGRPAGPSRHTAQPGPTGGEVVLAAPAPAAPQPAPMAAPIPPERRDRPLLPRAALPADAAPRPQPDRHEPLAATDDPVGLSSGPLTRGRALTAVTDVAQATLAQPQLPLALIVVAAVFVLVQNRIDRRDPKLAGGPLEPEPDLRFGPAYRKGGTGP